MATKNNLHLPGELPAEMRAKAAAGGKTVNELAAETLRNGLEDRQWQDLIAYGRERGRSIGFTEEQSGGIVHKWREEQPR